MGLMIINFKNSHLLHLAEFIPFLLLSLTVKEHKLCKKVYQLSLFKMDYTEKV